MKTALYFQSPSKSSALHPASERITSPRIQTEGIQAIQPIWTEILTVPASHQIGVLNGYFFSPTCT